MLNYKLINKPIEKLETCSVLIYEGLNIKEKVVMLTTEEYFVYKNYMAMLAKKRKYNK